MTEAINYELYRKVKSQDDYFVSWEPDQVNALTEDLKKQIYGRYVLKCEVFQRDLFSCQNIDCEFPDSPLTIHHIKFKKNGGKDTVRNGVTICNTCHTAFHRGKRGFSFADLKCLPVHIRGKSFKVSKKVKGIDWKKIKSEMKIIRKELQRTGSITKSRDLTTNQIILLMLWLSIPYDEYDD